VRKRAPEARFVVVGAGPPERLLGLGRDAGAVRFVGRVEKLSPLLRRARVMALPIRQGGGMRAKLPEAMASGLPVVSTRRGARGIALGSPPEILLAERPAAFADAVLRLLDDDEPAARQALAARRLVEERHRWEAIAQGVLAEYRRVLGA
jgi:glycosyltransferase involved in cell wall biosynthesis